MTEIKQTRVQRPTRATNKSGLPRKKWTPKNPRKKVAMKHVIGVALTEEHVQYINEESLARNIKPTELIRILIDNAMAGDVIF